MRLSTQFKLQCNRVVDTGTRYSLKRRDMSRHDLVSAQNHVVAVMFPEPIVRLSALISAIYACQHFVKLLPWAIGSE